jgi:hypothetical protein
MFALRDELFDYAAAGNVSFSDPAYNLLRKSMNGFIRYAHNLTFFRVVLVMLYWRVCSIHTEIKWWNSWNQAVSRVPDETVKAQLRSFHERAMTLVAERIILGSPILMLVLVVVACRSGIRTLADALTKSLDEFIDPRLLEEEAANAAA